MKATGKALVDHWAWAAKKGVMNQNTAGSLRVACSQVLSVLDNWETQDLTTINVEDVLRKFQNLKASKFKPQILEVYKRRFTNALSSYLAYVKDPGAWNPAPQNRKPRNKRVTDAKMPQPADTAAHMQAANGPGPVGQVLTSLPIDPTV